MKLTTKTVLLSGLLCPGAGYFAIKHYVRGCCVVGLTLLTIGLIVYQVLVQAQSVMQKMLESGVLTLDSTEIQQRIAEAPTVFPLWFSNGLLLLLLALWLGSVWDGYQLARCLQHERGAD